MLHYILSAVSVRQPWRRQQLLKEPGSPGVRLRCIWAAPSEASAPTVAAVRLAGRADPSKPELVLLHRYHAWQAKQVPHQCHVEHVEHWLGSRCRLPNEWFTRWPRSFKADDPDTD